MKDSIRNIVQKPAAKILHATLVWGLALGPLMHLPSEAWGDNSTSENAKARSASGRKIPFTQQDLVEIRAAAEREQIEETLERALKEYAVLKRAGDFQGKFLKGLDAADASRAKKHLESIRKLPSITRQGLVLKIGSGETELSIDFAEVKDRKLRFNGQVLYWHPNESLSTKMRYLQKKLALEKQASNLLLDLLFPRAHAVIPAAFAAASGITVVLVGSGIANNIINWYATPILKLVDNASCSLIVKAFGKDVTAWGPCVETVKGWETTAPAPEPVLNASKDKDTMVELAKKFDELEEAAECDVKGGKTYTTKVMVKETKEVFSVKINLKIEANESDGAVLTDTDGKERAKLSLINKNALKKAELSDKIVGTESGKMILALDATNKIEHLKPSEKAEWTNLENMLKYLDPSVVTCFKKIRDAANVQQKKDEAKGSTTGASETAKGQQ